MMRRLRWCTLALLTLGDLWAATPGVDGDERRSGTTPSKVHSLPLKQVSFTDGFWAPKLARYKAYTLPHSWHYMGWELRALRRAGGQTVEGELNGTRDCWAGSP